MQYLAGIFENLESVAKLTGDRVFTSILPGSTSLFKAIFAIWLLWNIGYKCLIKRELSLTFFIKVFLVTTTMTLFLSSLNFYKEWFYTPFYETSTKLLQTVLSSTSFNGQASNIQGVLGAIEKELELVIQLTDAVRHDSSFLRFDHFVFAMILRFAFEFLGLLYLSFAVEFVFGMMIVTALFPLIAVCLAFDATRSMGVLALKIPVHGALTLVVASLALSFVFTCIQSSVGSMPIDANGLKAGAADWTYTKGYDSLMIIVFLGGMFLMKAHQYVSSFLHINIGFGANVAMASAGAATLQYAKKGALGATSLAGKGAIKALSPYSQSILDRMQGR